MLNVLWLCSWYPNNVEPFNGDFVQRHAQAASIINKIHVIKLTPDPKAKNVTKITKTFQEWPNLTETLIYYPKPNSFVGKAIAYFRWYSIYKYAVEEYIKKNGKPHLVHVHVAYKAGVMAKYLWDKHQVPYVLTERWSGFTDIIKSNSYANTPSLKKSIIRKTLESAKSIHVPAAFLANHIRKHGYRGHYEVIPNHVDHKYFNYEPVRAKNEFVYLHVSSGSEEKDLPLLLNAYNTIKSDDTKLVVVGLSESDNRKYSKENPDVDFVGIVSHREVAEIMKSSSCLVACSLVEIFSNVTAEALCCGLPVIATKSSGIPEYADETNSILITPGNVNTLADAMVMMRQNIDTYDREQISQSASGKFDIGSVAMQTDAWYESILNPS